MIFNKDNPACLSSVEFRLICALYSADKSYIEQFELGNYKDPFSHNICTLEKKISIVILL